MSELVNWSLLAAFIPTFFFVSITPGLCMTLSLSLGITVGLRRSLWMMVGELVGVGLVAVCAALGAATVILAYPAFFTVFKLLGGAYLAYIGVQMWQAKGKLALSAEGTGNALISRQELMMQGFFTAIANPKGWAFFVTLLPPFLDTSKPLGTQLALLIVIILLLEFSCLLIYCLGGNSLRRFLQNPQNVQRLNRLAGALMVGVAIWLVAG